MWIGEGEKERERERVLAEESVRLIEGERERESKRACGKDGDCGMTQKR